LLDTVHLIIAAVVMLVGAVILSATGFGIGLVTTPFLLLVFDPKTVVVLINTIAAGLLAMVLADTRDHLEIKANIPLAVSAVLGVPVGVIALSSLSAVALRIGITVLIILLTIIVALNIRVKVPAPRVSGPIIGFAVSALVTGLAIGGPLMMLFLMNFNYSVPKIRATMAFYYMPMGLAAIVGYAVAGLYTRERILLVLAVVIPSIVGYRLAVLIVRRINDAMFRRGVVAIIAITSVIVLAREVVTAL